ncbi:cysteinyl-tRNA ligase [Moraxella macacae 0408225]|uniref:Cysteine--tRNA ligase n=1 Tax=Moraxella macacae 0408225 TaxID=1230338 RepID=L2F6B7_9GAMM|nr:cysteine--tRNA ligase [Moraxella macacae]ELA08341.1 cysteinyl-tRNA ligase [Moraxella macacae 0408225]
MSDLHLYDTLTAKKRPFTPIEDGKVGLYVCGMTVYDYCHIGHARVMVSFDVIYRWLSRFYQVNYVRNITDIDDKIIKRAGENGESIFTLTERFTKAMHEDADNLGCLRPTHEPKATDYIPQMLNMITTLQNKQLAYQGDSGDVYYKVENFADYGKLSKRRLADMQAGIRVDTADDKQNPFDFVLWKSAKESEPDETKWQSPFGQGRPGWHIECSAMSTCCLGDNFDIHGGGHDLQFPHHENEIAQSEGATQKPYANNWLHVGFVNVDGEKMSKSLNNFFTIRDVLKDFHAEVIRFFMLSSHYRSPINFSDTALKEAHASLSRLYHALKLFHDDEIIIDECVWQSDYGQAFSRAMHDDFNTPKALSVLFQLVGEINKAFKNNELDKSKHLAKILKTLAEPLNIAQAGPNEFLQKSLNADGLSETEILAKIDARTQAKIDKNFTLADQIRDELNAQGIELEDSRAGTMWRRI